MSKFSKFGQNCQKMSKLSGLGQKSKNGHGGLDSQGRQTSSSYSYSTKKRASRASALRADGVTVRVDF